MIKKNSLLLTICLSTLIALKVGISGQPLSKPNIEANFRDMKIQRDDEGHIVSALPMKEAKPLKTANKKHLDEKVLQLQIQAFLDAWTDDSGESKEAWRISSVQKTQLGATAEIERLHEGLPVWPYHYIHLKLSPNGDLLALEASLPPWEKPLGSFSLKEEEAIQWVQSERKSKTAPDAVLKGIFVEAPSGQGHYAFRIFVAGEEWVLSGHDGALLSFRSHRKHLMAPNKVE